MNEYFLSDFDHIVDGLYFWLFSDTYHENIMLFFPLYVIYFK